MQARRNDSRFCGMRRQSLAIALGVRGRRQTEMYETRVVVGGGESSARGDRSNLGTDRAVHKNKMTNDKEW